jgi:hypothetical protein
MRSVRTGYRKMGWVFASLVLALAGCKKEEQHEADQADAGLEDAGGLAKLDPELAEAVAAASARAPTPNLDADQGPPPRGIFTPVRADKEARKGSRARVDLGSDGADPKVSFLPAQLEAASKVKGTIQVQVQQGQQGGLPIQFALSVEAQKPKEGEAPEGSVKMVAKITDAKVPVAGAGQEVTGLIGKLKGARVTYVVAQNGEGSGYGVEVPAGAPPDLSIWLETLRDAIALVTIPVPAKPLGVGAYWMVTSREGVLGLDLVSYRMVKIEAMDKGVATLSVNAKRYAASPALDLKGLPDSVPKEMAEFQSATESRLEVKPGSGFPLGGELSSALAIGLGPAPAPGPNQRGQQQQQQQGLMIQSRGTLQFAR